MLDVDARPDLDLELIQLGILRPTPELYFLILKKKSEEGKEIGNEI